MVLDDGSLQITTVIEFNIGSESEDQSGSSRYLNIVNENLSSSLGESDFILTIDGKTFKSNNDHTIEVRETCQLGLVKVQLTNERIICRKCLTIKYIVLMFHP